MLPLTSSSSTDVNNANTNGDNVRVAVRIRPLIEREELAGSQNSWISDTTYLQQIDPDTKWKSSNAVPHVFDHVFGVEQKTSEVYNQVISPIINEAFNGFNGTVLCYGQTSSGKTFTLYGNDQEEGIISLAARDLFKRVSNDNSNSYVIRVGLLEIYNEKVSDLLSGNEVTISEIGGIVVPKNLSEVQVLCPQDILENVKKVQSQRKIGETRMNKESSRSHTILRIQLDIIPIQSTDLKEAEEIQVTSALLNFVDLAGSEKAGQTGAQGERFREATFINKSLSVLAQVVMQLTSGGSGDIGLHNASVLNVTASASAISKRAQAPRYINFRDSKLTHILKNSLSGNAFTAIICNVTPALLSLEETLSTLRFAKTAKTIKTAPKPNHKMLNNEESKQKIRELQLDLDRKQSEVDYLRKQLGVYHKFAICKTPPNNDKIPVSGLSERRKTWCTNLIKPKRSRSFPHAEFITIDEKEINGDSKSKTRSDDIDEPQIEVKRRRTDVFMSPSDALIHFCELEKQRNFEPVPEVTSTPKPKAQHNSPPQLKLTEDAETQTELPEANDVVEDSDSNSEAFKTPHPPKPNRSKYFEDTISLNDSSVNSLPAPALTIPGTPGPLSRQIRANLCVALIDQAKDAEAMKIFHNSELEIEKAKVADLERKFETLEYEHKQLEKLNTELIRVKRRLLEEIEASRATQGQENQNDEAPATPAGRNKELEDKIELLKAELAKTKNEVDELKNSESSQIADLQEENERLNSENKELKAANTEQLSTIANMEAVQEDALTELSQLKKGLQLLALETLAPVETSDASVLCEIITETSYQIESTEQSVQTDDLPKSVLEDQCIQTDNILRTDQENQTEEKPIVSVDQNVQTEKILQVEEDTQTDEVNHEQMDQIVQTDEILKTSRDIQTICEAEVAEARSVSHRFMQTDVVFRSDQEIQTEDQPKVVPFDQNIQTDDIQVAELAHAQIQTEAISQTHQDIQTDEEPRALVADQCFQTDEEPRVLLADQSLQTEQSTAPLVHQFMQTDDPPTTSLFDRLVQTDEIPCPVSEQVTQTLDAPRSNQDVQTDELAKTALQDQWSQTTEDVPPVAMPVVRVEQHAQTDGVPTGSPGGDQSQNSSTGTPRRKMNRSAQTEPGLDMTTRYRDLLIRYKTDEKRNQKERDDLSKEVKRFEGMVKELKTTATLKEDEITRLKDSISYMKTKEELNRFPKNCATTEVQCNYMAELIERARFGEHGLLPPDFPDISKMTEENKRLTQEVFLLKAKNAKLNGDSDIAPAQNKNKFNMDWMKQPPSQPHRMFENKMPSKIDKDLMAHRRTPSVIHSSYPSKLSSSSSSSREGQDFKQNDSNHSNSSSRADSFKLPFHANLNRISENVESSRSTRESPAVAGSNLSKFISPAPGQETVIEVQPKSQTQRESYDIFREISENHASTSSASCSQDKAVPPPDEISKAANVSVGKPIVETSPDDFADEIERMLGMK